MAPFDRSSTEPRAAQSPPVATVPTGAQMQQLQALRARLLAGHSATGTLETWCGEHGAVPATVHARRVHLQRPVPPQVRDALRVGQDTQLQYRRVQLVCGSRVLSEADNWYLPGLLTAAMNDALERSDEPFGRVVAPLHFQRETLRDALYWPPQGEAGNGAILEIHALLRDARQRPFSYVVETYLQRVLAPGDGNSNGLPR